MTMMTAANPYASKGDRFDDRLSEASRDLAKLMLDDRNIVVTGERIERLAEADASDTNRLLKQFSDEDRNGYDSTRGGGSFLSGDQSRDSGYTALREGNYGTLLGVSRSVGRMEELSKATVKMLLQRHNLIPTHERIEALMNAPSHDEVERLLLTWAAGDEKTDHKPKPGEIFDGVTESTGGETSYQKLREQSKLFGSR